MTRILGLSGSLRSGSYNTALLKAAAPLLDAGVELEIALLHGIPLYDGDLEAAEGLPEAVRDLRARVMACDGLLLATPEYNNGIPGVFKNAIDWLSRPPSDIPQVFGARPVAVIGDSPGGFGTLLAQNAWLPVLRTLRMRPWFGGRLLVSRATQVFNKSGELVDETVRGQLREFLRGFVQFIQAGASLPRRNQHE
jgi:NAD(P)H-dependent FMN reductase